MNWPTISFHVFVLRPFSSHILLFILFGTAAAGLARRFRTPLIVRSGSRDRKEDVCNLKSRRITYLV
ncbi:hypothetical protein K445DRAFT_264311 [Daldinia sp. EC12]|nr:hypothetical protein F4774DRAFT_140343 [Daldinia eschscholtzii]OTB17901.1 hypothetical protein K445DRAFT_264311 [Daldinia sp. EC12]